MSDRSDPVFDALGEPSRRRILELLRDGPQSVGALAVALPVGRPAVSRHLRVLGDAGLVTHRTEGTRNLYALAPDGLAPLQVWLTSTWDRAFSAYADAVREHARTRTEGPTSHA